MQPHQQRVIDEARELKSKMDALFSFITGDRFTQLPHDEQLRLQRQHKIMELYHDVLFERICAFE